MEREQLRSGVAAHGRCLRWATHLRQGHDCAPHAGDRGVREPLVVQRWFPSYLGGTRGGVASEQEVRTPRHAGTPPQTGGRIASSRGRHADRQAAEAWASPDGDAARVVWERPPCAVRLGEQHQCDGTAPPDTASCPGSAGQQAWELRHRPGADA